MQYKQKCIVWQLASYNYLDIHEKGKGEKRGKYDELALYHQRRGRKNITKLN